jgi:predicted negative regulator of RcsB-dependent stress response
MARTRFRRKDLKRPDEFVSQGRQLILWAQDNSRFLYQILGGVAAAFLIVGVFFSVRGARARQANEDLSRALGEYRAGRYSEAATQLADVGNRWGSTTAGGIATLYAASADLKANNFESAALLLQDALAARQWPPYLRQQVLVSLAFALESKGDAAAAAARYGEGGAIAGPYTVPAILGEARCREVLGEREAARKLYERLVREFPHVPEVEAINAKVMQLAG